MDGLRGQPVLGAVPAARTNRLPALDWGSWQTPFVLFTGKGGVGKTTVAGAVAVALADAGRRVLVVGTDPASNLGELFGTTVGAQRCAVDGVPGLEVLDLDPDTAADAYRERVIAPYRGTVPEEELRSIEEQLAGECTVEVAAFDRFTQLIVHPEQVGSFDHVVFDTAPTGHTLRLLSLPAAWSRYLDSGVEGASCLGPQSGLESQHAQYAEAVEQLGDPARTTVVLVSRPDASALREAGRAGTELAEQGIRNQRLVVNGLFTGPLAGDVVAEAFAARQAAALGVMPPALRGMPAAAVPLVAFELTGIGALRELAANRARALPGPEASAPAPQSQGGRGEQEPALPGLDALVDELAAGPPRAILVMGKGGVGKTTIATAIAAGLVGRGHEVHLSTTDPAGRFTDVLEGDIPEHLTVDRIDPRAELARYTAGRLHAAAHLDAERRALLEEDLRSPCTQELAVFRAFAGLLTEARRRYVVVDTAPSGHTLRLLDLTGSYHRQTMADADRIAGRITTPLMRLQDPSSTRVLIVTLPEPTPVSEAAALQDDLHRAGIEPYGWVVNAALTGSGTRDPLLRARAALEHPHLHRVRDELAARTWLMPWHSEDLPWPAHPTAGPPG
ncbi:arsenical pump-driving ATPase [Kitasatospora sp. NPDC048722]|uniref:arsenical pump-driving ATPase n=1 Tax=Kitasatospora sp. NPDC048722 TaxID=3155639 RepID=UPI0034090DB9